MRNEIVKLCQKIGFEETKINEIILAVTEMLSNVVKHGGGVALIEVSEWEHQGQVMGIEIHVQDKGIGMKDISKAMEESMASNGSSGYGLASIKRLADEFLIISSPSDGTTSSDFKKSGTLLIFRKKR